MCNVRFFCVGVVATTDVVEACKGVNIAIMVGGFPRKEGMERKDVMSKNVSIYKSQASALEEHAARDVKVSISFGYVESISCVQILLACIPDSSGHMMVHTINFLAIYLAGVDCKLGLSWKNESTLSFVLSGSGGCQPSKHKCPYLEGVCTFYTREEHHMPHKT